MRIPCLKIALAAGLLSAPIGVGKIRQCCKTESADTFVRTLETGVIPKLKNDTACKFMQSLIENEDKIKTVLKITDKQYKTFCDLAIGIAKEETDFGLDNSYIIKETMPSVANTVKNWVSKNKLSEGITNFKIKSVNNQMELNALKALDVKDVFNPKQAATGTIVHLKTLYDDYQKYLKNIAPHQTEPLSSEEYILARWKGLRLNTVDKNSEIKAMACENMKAIISDRTNPNPKTHVWKILRSIGYAFENKTVQKILKSVK